MDRLIRTVSVVVPLFVAGRSHYVWYWQPAVLLAVFCCIHGVVFAIRFAVAQLNKRGGQSS